MACCAAVPTLVSCAIICPTPSPHPLLVCCHHVHGFVDGVPSSSSSPVEQLGGVCSACEIIIVTFLKRCFTVGCCVARLLCHEPGVQGGGVPRCFVNSVAFPPFTQSAESGWKVTCRSSGGSSVSRPAVDSTTSHSPAVMCQTSRLDLLNPGTRELTGICRLCHSCSSCHYSSHL